MAAAAGVSSADATAATCQTEETASHDERSCLEATLRECKWNKRAAAEKLGIPYKTLLAKLRSYDLS